MYMYYSIVTTTTTTHYLLHFKKTFLRPHCYSFIIYFVCLLFAFFILVFLLLSDNNIFSLFLYYLRFLFLYPWPRFLFSFHLSLSLLENG